MSTSPRLAFPRPLATFVLLFNALFAGQFLVVSAFNRLAGDDLTFVMWAERFGVIGAVGHWWHIWFGRWASSLLIG